MSIEKPAVLQTPPKNVTPAVQQRQTAGRKEKLVAASIHKSEVRKFWKEKLRADDYIMGVLDLSLIHI